jgi:hypothetical protein
MPREEENYLLVEGLVVFGIGGSGAPATIPSVRRSRPAVDPLIVLRGPKPWSIPHPVAVPCSTNSRQRRARSISALLSWAMSG